MNWLDKTIGFVAPGAALKRAQQRLVLDQVRSYDAAKMGRRGGGWKAVGTSANAEIGPSLATVRARAREQVRNNPYARQAINKLAAKTVGTGIVARPKGKQTENLWKQWIKIADFDGHYDYYGLQMLQVRALFESGEVLIRRFIDRSLAGVPLRLQVLEGDYLDASKTGPLPNGNYGIAGVEVDRLGRRQAYWLFDHHPGDLVILPRSFVSVRVPASEIIHLYEKERPGQMRGMSRLATSLMKLRDLADYEDAELLRKKIEACFAAFVTTADTNRTLANEQASTSTTAAAPRIETFSPGMIEYLKPGELVEFGNPSASGGYGEYTKTQLHAIAAGAGTTYQQLTGDLSSVNLSSIRAGMIDFNEMIDQLRWLTFIPVSCDQIYTWFIEVAYLAGMLRTQTVDVRHTPPKRTMVDPIKEVQAERLEAQGGIESISEQIRSRGNDPLEKFEEISAERALLKKMGIVVDTDPANKIPTTPNSGAGGANDNEPAAGDTPGDSGG